MYAYARVWLLYPADWTGIGISNGKSVSKLYYYLSRSILTHTKTKRKKIQHYTIRGDFISLLTGIKFNKNLDGSIFEKCIPLKKLKWTSGFRTVDLSRATDFRQNILTMNLTISYIVRHRPVEDQRLYESTLKHIEDVAGF